MTAHAIGKPRIYEPGQRVKVYPGEEYHLSALIPHDEIALSLQAGFPVEITEHARVTVTPLPGWYGAWLRTKWRLFGRFGIHGIPGAVVVLSLAAMVVVWVEPAIAVGLSSFALWLAVFNALRGWQRRRRARFTVDTLKGQS